MSLHRIFDPASIAVVGASAEPAKRGNQILRALRESGYAGHVYPVNPRGGEILGQPVLASVDDLPEGVDLAVLCTPAAAAPGLVRACGVRGVAGAVVLAVGFGESGDHGRALEDELRDAGRESGVRIIGPNTSGMLNLEKGVNLVGARGVRSGGLAVLVQSGNMALALMTEVSERSWDGISIYLGVGNGIDLGFAEALEYLEHHAATRAVVAYVEGLPDAGAFLEVAARVSRTKPVVALKSGRTARGAEAALSHTGAVAGPYERLSAGLAQAGVVELKRADELLHVAETLGRQPAPRPGSGIAILSDGGGQGTLAVDLLDEWGARLASLDGSTRDALRDLLGPAAAVANPVDLAGAADLDPEMFGRAVQVLAADPSVGAILVIGLFGGYGIRFDDSLTAGERAGAVAMAEHAGSAGCGLVVHTMYALHRSPPLEDLGMRGVPVVASLEAACRCVAELQRRGDRLGREPWRYEPPRAHGGPPASPAGRGGSTPGASDTVVTDARHALTDARRTQADVRHALTEPEARALLSGHGMPFGPSVVADSEDAVVEALRELGAPVAVKLVSDRITHKSDVGGVVLGVADDAGARGAFRSIAGPASGHAYGDGGDAQGADGSGPRRGSDVGSGDGEPPCRVLVTPMLRAPRAELLVGAYRDADLGPVLSVGAGGVWVEALADVTVRVLPVDDREAAAMLTELRIGRVLPAARGFPAVDVGPILASIRAVADAITRRPDVVEVEVNPLFVYDDRAVPVDARVVLRGARGETGQGA